MFRELEILHYNFFSQTSQLSLLSLIMKIAWRSDHVFMYFFIHLRDNNRLKILCY